MVGKFPTSTQLTEGRHDNDRRWSRERVRQVKVCCDLPHTHSARRKQREGETYLQHQRNQHYREHFLQLLQPCPPLLRRPRLPSSTAPRGGAAGGAAAAWGADTLAARHTVRRSPVVRIRADHHIRAARRSPAARIQAADHCIRAAGRSPVARIQAADHRIRAAHNRAAWAAHRTGAAHSRAAAALVVPSQASTPHSPLSGWP
jgi:hypothetical protein